jgi:hypothetical protein
LNNKGQFSIIAALLISIIFVSTVILTYTVILNDSIRVQPQVLTAIDETNFAIKQMLGFSVGYYGSVIRVTGDTSFANQSTFNYTTSGLEYVAYTHAEWGAGFSLTNLTVHTYWFNNTSYSTGHLSVTYNLTKLGIYGVQYAPSCGLTVQIVNSTQNNQTSLIVTRDQNEPITDLEQRNFQFFQYQTANSTWTLVSPTTSPVAYTNGTYQIQPPAGIDVNSYVVQVEDQRGIIVVASPYSSYMMNLTWPSISVTTLFAHQETTNINGTNYYKLLPSSADTSGLMINASSSGSRTLFAQSVYALQGVSTIPVGAWMMYYRAWEDAGTIAIDAVGHGNNGDGGSSISWSHTTGSGSNRIMIVGISIRSSSVNASSISYGSQSLTFIRRDINSNGILSELWYLIAPTSGTRNITANLTGSAKATGGSCTYTGVAQISPIDASNGGSGSSSSPSQSLTVNTANSFLLGHVAIRSTSTTVQSEGSGQTTRWDEIAGTSSAARGHGSDKGPIATGSQSMSWTLSQSADWAVSVVAIKPGPRATGRVEVDLLIRESNGSIRNTIAIGVAASGNLTSAPTTLSGNYSWPTYIVMNQTDYLEIDYYVNATTAGSLIAHLTTDDQTLPTSDQTRATGLNLSGSTLRYPSDTITIELLQNGTMRWLGQNLLNTTQSMPIPPLPVKSIHVNQTINGVDSEVPFQIEDWASDYLIPLGLTGNLSVFSGGNMIVFLVNSNVSRVAVWWNGSDLATQTPYAFVNRYFTGDNPSAGTLTNGMLTLQFGGSFTLMSTVGSSSCTATFMRLNGQASTYGASPAYVIASGVVRDIVQQEAEWSNGAPNSPNLYAHIVLTLPANATYYTYELRALFVQSQQSRTVTDLCPIKLQTSFTQPMTENGTAGGYPTVSNATGTFYNQSSVWAHHWSQLISGTNGAGIMFTDAGNSQLYSFDSLAGTQTGELGVNAGTIELLPVERIPVSFTYPLNTIWCGAVSTFSNTTPIYQTASGQVSGSWISVEYPPTVALYT